MNKTYYRDMLGNLVYVSPGISDGNVWMTVRQPPGKPVTKRIKSPVLPLRKTQELAQKDLDAYAKQKGFSRVGASL